MEEFFVDKEKSAFFFNVNDSKRFNRCVYCYDFRAVLMPRWWRLLRFPKHFRKDLISAGKSWFILPSKGSHFPPFLWEFFWSCFGLIEGRGRRPQSRQQSTGALFRTLFWALVWTLFWALLWTLSWALFWTLSWALFWALFWTLFLALFWTLSWTLLGPCFGLFWSLFG